MKKEKERKWIVVDEGSGFVILKAEKEKAADEVCSLLNKVGGTEAYAYYRARRYEQ